MPYPTRTCSGGWIHSSRRDREFGKQKYQAPASRSGGLPCAYTNRGSAELSQQLCRCHVCSPISCASLATLSCKALAICSCGFSPPPSRFTCCASSALQNTTHIAFGLGKNFPGGKA